MLKMPLRAGLIAVALASLVTLTPLRAEDQSAIQAAGNQQYENLLEVLLQTSTTIIGQPIAYPAKPATITAAVVTIPPGGETGWHKHEVPLVAYILEGALTLDYGEKGVHTVEAGSAVAEAIEWAHNGSNKGNVPVRLFAVYMGAEDLKNTIALPH